MYVAYLIQNSGQVAAQGSCLGAQSDQSECWFSSTYCSGKRLQRRLTIFRTGLAGNFTAGPSITEKLPELPRTPTIIALAFEEFFVGQICAMLSSITALIVFMEQ
ncbi:uncharacterized protein LOC142775514 [Rhipicephalus microplus]|uniref:uncharacterized protein LOC142775514 n=1 Tax=Rhipicephalus microplus TaxID=6941 RepID=UPI003F6AF57A